MQNALWLEPRRFSRAEAWIYMLLRANHQETTVFLGSDSYDLKPGEFITSQIKMAEAWEWDRETVKKFLDYLTREKNISYKTSNKNTIITILNWDIYQKSDYDKPATEPTTEPASTPQQNQHQSSTDNNDKKDKNEKNYLPKDEIQKIIEQKLSRIATKALVKEVMRVVPEKMWWMINKYLNETYPGGGNSFEMAQKEINAEIQQNLEKLKAITSSL